MGILHGYVVHGQDAWVYTLDALGRYYERIQTLPPETAQEPTLGRSLLAGVAGDITTEIRDTIGIYVNEAETLGKCTAELHLTLASDPKSKDFAPEYFTTHYQRSLYQSMRKLASENLQLLRKRLRSVPEAVKGDAEGVLALEGEVQKRFRAVFEKRISAMRIRDHGDYHLGQVLHTGKGFVILDFEGEPARSLSERRLKRSPLRDVAGMLRSFHYAAFAALYRQVEQGVIHPESVARIEPWARYWYFWVSVAFLRTYFAEVRQQGLLPREDSQLQILLEANLLEKAIYELGYELNNRPQWLKIPLQGILQLLEAGVPA